MRSCWRYQPGTYFCISTKRLDGKWEDHFFARDELASVEAFVRSRRDEDVFFCPHAFSQKRRKKECSVLPKALYADLDEANPRTIKYRPTIAIESSPGRYVGIWECDGPITEALNKRMSYHVEADKSGWDLTQVLRYPGTRNLKYPSKPIVKLLWDDGPDYSVDELEQRLPQIARREVSTSDTPWEFVEQLDGRAIIRKYRAQIPILRAPLIRKADGTGDRSATAVWHAGILHRAGATKEEIAAVLTQGSEAFRSKYGTQINKRVMRGFESVYASMRNRP